MVLFLVMPGSGFSTEDFRVWHDQSVYLEALRSVLEGRSSPAIDGDIVGPSYVALAWLVHAISDLTPEASLVVLSKTVFAASVGAAMVVVRSLVIRLADDPPPILTLAAQSLLVVVVLSSWTWRWADVPWTHFVALAAAVAFFALRVVRPDIGLLAAGAIGVVLALLALARSFEFLALAVAWASAWALFTALGLRRPRTLTLLHGLVGGGAFLLTALAVHVVARKSDVFFLYGSNLGRLSADVRPEEVADTPTLAFEFVPTKLVQLFVDPCFYSLCSLDDYRGAPNNLEEIWRMPLAIQLPALLLLPVCALALALLVGRSARRRESESGRISALRQLVEMTIAAGGITIAYTASSLAGPSHLKYGFVREYLLPAALIGVVAVVLACSRAWLVVRARGSVRVGRVGASPEFRIAAGGVVVGLAMIATVSIAREHGLPRVTSRHLGTVSYEATCRGETCRVVVDAVDVNGAPISLPESSTLTFGCGSDRPRFSLYSGKPSAGITISPTCDSPRLVSAWPLIMGLPPNSLHLRAIEVSNT